MNKATALPKIITATLELTEMPVERTLDGHFRDERRIAALENA
ncbi:hypothetical protein [Caballeronia telluris]|nr:hypothetical protein [Caballeronia telluris]